MTQYITQKHNLNDYQPPPEALLQSAVDALPSHVAMLNDQADIIAVNQAWCRFADQNDYQHETYGIGVNYLTICEQAVGRNSEESLSVAEGIRQIINEREHLFHLEYPCHSATTKRWFNLQVTRFDWQDEMRVIMAHQNITDLRQTQALLDHNQRRLQAIMDTVVDGILTVDEQGYIESINPAVADIFRYPVEELVGIPLAALMPEPYRTQYDNYIRRHRRVNAQRYAEVGHEIQGVRRDGSQFPMYLAMSRAYMEGRWLFTGIVQDLTPRKRIEQQLLEKERLQSELQKERDLRELKNRFMSMISHELRTPLSVISLSSDFLRRYSDRMDEIEKTETVSTIQTQVQHLENLVDDVAALSRTESLETQVHTETIDILDFCGDVVANAQMMYAETHRIIFDVKGNCSRIPGDPKLLRQAFTNLLGNAVKYSEAGTRVTFSLRCEPEQVIIRVSDQGIGIPLEDQPKLFEAFHRATNVGVRPGTGLGLAVTKRAIEMHKGHITFETKTGVGTTFIITLPILADI